MTWTAWRTHFDANFPRPLPEAAPPPLDGQARRALARTLALFQRGETGEGRLAREIDGVQLPGVDADYRHCLKRAVAEEGRHARILARMVQGLGGTLVQSNWTEVLFRRARRLLGVRFKLVVVLVAEVVGGAFYGLLARAVPDSPLRRALEELCADEAAHLRFHRQFLKLQAQRPLAFALMRGAYWPVVTLAITVVLAHHGATLAHFGITRREALGVLWGAAQRAALEPAPRRGAARTTPSSPVGSPEGEVMTTVKPSQGVFTTRGVCVSAASATSSGTMVDQASRSRERGQRRVSALGGSPGSQQRD